MPEVLALVFHLIVTTFFIGGYLYTVAIGTPDETLRNLSLLSGGYWFGAVGGAKAVDRVTKSFSRDKKGGGSNG